MKIAIGADHGGFYLKETIASFLKQLGHEVIDVGTDNDAPVDYPDYARAVSREVLDNGAERGILICGSGVGACVAANKIPGIRAAMCHDSFSARQGIEDDNVNVLCLGARIIGPELAKDVVRIWLASSFSGAERHVRRLAKVNEIEKEYMNNESGVKTHEQ